MDIPIFTTSPTNPPITPVDSGSPPSKPVEQITAEIASKHATDGTSGEPARVRKKRSDAGKPRVKSNLAQDTTQNQNGVSSPSGETIGYTLDKAVVEKTAGVILNTVDMAVIRRVYKAVIRYGGDKELAEELARNAGMQKEESGMISQLTAIVFEKHGWLSGYAPEILLGVMLTQYGLRVTLTLKRLDAMEKDFKARNKPASKDASPSSAN